MGDLELEEYLNLNSGEKEMNLGVKTALFLAPPLPSFVNLGQHLVTVEPHFHLLNRDNTYLSGLLAE